MTYIFAWCLTLIFFSLTAKAWPKPHQKPPVCIIGAGPSGLTAASKLEANGIKAVVFDKQSDLGGKCQSYYDELGIFHPLGAAFYSNASYAETVKVVNTSGVLAEEFELAGAREQFLFNDTTGAIEPVPETSAQVAQALQAEIPRYINLWYTTFPQVGVVGYKNGVPEELTVPGVEWFHANNFTVLPLVLVNPLALYGYGDINIVPALYILQYITPDLLTAFIGEHNVYYIDFHKVWVEFVKKAACKTQINLSHEVRCIDRSGENPVIKYTKPCDDFYEWGQQECSSIIMAFPPTIENLERAGLDLTKEENDVFKDVGVHNYFSSAVEFELPFGVSYIAESANPTVPPPNDGEPVAVLRLSEQSNVSTSWSWGPYMEFESESSARELLIETLSRINKDPRNSTESPEPVTDNDVKAFRKWDYFPHFDTEPLKNDAYAKLNDLQGCKKTYWASGLQGMETVEWAIRAGRDVVESYILKDGYLG
ncbi:FAD/NAD(P)-binding domain-containing protein [Lophiostoma macrostomum CBS 122681]|uniref:FAD/NAD(P)-binding domain-containing protein n=1 Tax=Lophiostoma macrostomum CBS 122681 TaxID=1314788 RepID=A0A6A6T3X2_9PLEO|nr:FAD/NAD(P)-binding domain-containing protein [Lophiostoma macrostomum CBS 122681]